LCLASSSLVKFSGRISGKSWSEKNSWTKKMVCACSSGDPIQADRSSKDLAQPHARHVNTFTHMMLALCWVLIILHGLVKGIATHHCLPFVKPMYISPTHHHGTSNSGVCQCRKSSLRQHKTFIH
jgi:hypothetical protein